MEKSAFYRILVGLFAWTLANFVLGEVDEGHSEWDYVLCVQEEGGKVVDRVGVMYNAEVLDYACIEKAIYQLAEIRSLNAVQQAWLNDLYTSLRTEATEAGNGGITVRERKEYRMLSVDERSRFHKAVNDFKNDLAEKYDALSSLHVGETAVGAHRGPGFFVWNRLYMLLFELALRQYDPEVTLPYWDNTIDSKLEHPEQSIIWDDTFAGNGNGRVLTGPFAAWRYRKRHLMRNIGQSGRLMKPSDVDKIMRSDYLLKDISFPSAKFEDNLELHSFGVRLWVGGEMARLDTATNDPLYFLLHAYYDCVWQQFREVEAADPETDWPTKFEGNVAHYPNAQVGIVPNLRNRQALRNEYGSLIYRCVHPTCSLGSPTCGSSGLYCNTATFTCETRVSSHPASAPCKGSSGYQNSYCLDGNNCDEKDWVYLPVEIVYTRHPEHQYNSKPMTSPSQMLPDDIYSPSRFRINGIYNNNMAISKEYPASKFEDCRCTNWDTGRLYIQSYGLNYNGTYREYSMVDKRLPVSSVWTYIAIKDPRDSADFKSRAQIRVYDDCGRICRAVCLVKGSNDYLACSAVLTVSTEEPKQYSETMEDAFYVNWDYTTQYPDGKRDVTFLKFYCDSSAVWPWLVYSYIEDPYKPKPPPPTDPDTEDLQTTTTTTTAAPTTTTVTTTTTTQPTTTVLIKSEWCFNETECYQDYEPTNCTRCQHEDLSLCWDHCGKFRHCSKGIWYIKNCTIGLLWDDRDEVKTCNYNFNVPCREGGACLGCRNYPLPPPWDG